MTINNRKRNEGDPEIKVTGTNLPANKQTLIWNTTYPYTVDATLGTISLGLCWWAERPLHR